MATRVDKTSGLGQLNESSLLRRLRLAAPRREGKANFIGLKRSSALADVGSPAKSLDNILGKISQTNAAERNLYGRSFNGVDWNVTSDFIDEQINRQFLLPLSGASVEGGLLGSQVNTTPRNRIEDRISLANSYFGEGSFPNLHSGPDAKFYRSVGPELIGFIKFSFTDSSVTVTELKGPDKTTDLTAFGTEDEVVLDVAGYELSEPVSLSGSGIALRLVASGSVWTVEEGLENLTSIRTLLGVEEFSDVFFRLVRPYSVINPPLWFTSNPGETGAEGPDDTNPDTSLAVLESENGNVDFVTAKGYWFSREYVETRWTATEQSLIGANSVTEDSNMRWLNPPSPLRGEQYNWGIRWDGYLRLTAGTYGLQVQTNVSVRIDMGVGAGPGYWVNVFDTSSNSAQENTDTYVSSETFNTNAVAGRFKHVTGAGANDWVAYVPITIRMFRGGADKAQPNIIIPSEPNLFIKTTAVTNPLSFYSQQHTVTLTGTNGSWGVAGTTLAQIIDVLTDEDAEVTFSITAQGSNIFPSPVSIVLTTNGATVSSTTSDPALATGSHTLIISPSRTSEFNDNLTALWKGRIASPGPGQTTYADLVDGTYSPDQQKVAYGSRPDWWKTTEGHPYDRSLAASVDNTPLDGLIQNSFKPVLQSDVAGLGLYGNGSGTYTNRPNIIIGEARYGVGSDPGSNYTSLLLTTNDLGEGGKLIVNAFPINNSTGTAANLLGANDLGGDPNHKTVITDSNSVIAQLYLWSPENKYYLESNLAAVSASDDPTLIGLPAFSDTAWGSPITVTATQVADNFAFTTNVKGFVAPLVLSVEKVTVTVGGNNYDLVAFSTTLASILANGSEVSQFSGKYVRFYNESNSAFQYAFVDSGEGVSFSDVLKLTYNSGVFNGAQSEIPRPPSDRVTPFDFDEPEYGSGLCYPPYSIGNPLLKDIAIEDADLYDNKPAGNYDVFWGDHTKADLEGKVLEILERLEFSAQNLSDVVSTVSLTTPLLSSNYSHRLRIDMPLNPAPSDPDQIEHIGNGEKVKDSYYLYVKLDS